MALGLKVTGGSVDIIGTRTYQYLDVYTYDNIKTDAEIFIYRRKNGQHIIDFINGSFIAVENLKARPLMRFNGESINPEVYKYKGGCMSIRFSAPKTGTITFYLK